MTQECLQTWSTDFACKISTLSIKYKEALDIGSSCADVYLMQLEVATALLEQICDINLSEETGKKQTVTCLSEDQICKIIDKLTQILNNSCDC